MRTAAALTAAGLAALAVAVPGAADQRAASAAPTARLVKVGTFDDPVFVTAPPKDRERLFVVEKDGVIRIVRDGRKLSAPFLDISGPVNSSGSEQGLLSMAFAPDYATSRRFYVYFTGTAGDIHVREFRRSASDPERADRGSARTVLRVGHRSFGNHNGGQLQFGPDGLLYISTGDGGGAGDPQRNAQDLGSRLGKILRIDPRRRSGRRYTIPKGNPFRRKKRAAAEIYAYGLRNPWRFSFDRRLGDIVIADVGQDRVEEIDFRRRGKARGANFGWNRFEGRRRFSSGRARGHVKPLLERSHSSGYCSITGGYVVRDKALGDLYGRYVYSDYCLGQIRSVRLGKKARGDSSAGPRISAVSSFGEDARGRVYVTSLADAVYRLAAP